MAAPQTPGEVLSLIKERNIKMVDIRFMDLPGMWQHFSVPADIFSEDDFQDGFGFDGSSIRGWQEINESDMLVIPDPVTTFLDPYLEIPTLVIAGNIVDPITREPYGRDPRNVAQKAENYLKSTGLADVAYFGPEAEFFVFDDIRYDQTVNSGFYFIDSEEGNWNSGTDEGPNLGYKLRPKEGYFPVPPSDTMQDLRSEMVLNMMEMGIIVECQHHEVATGGQAEIDMQFAPLLLQADNLLKYKYVVRNTARKYGKTATFMAKPLFGDNGTGMHTHVSLWKDGKPLFAGDEYAGISKMALYAIGGLLEKAPALLALTNPTTNSYKRLVPGYEAPVNLAYSSRNRSAAIRIPMYSGSPKAKRIEFRCPDPTCNPYLAFSALLMAVLYGIQNKIDPGQPLDKNIYDLPPEELANVPNTPASLEESLAHLERDHDFLLQGDVFSEDLIQAWISYKRENEVDALRVRPHPYEFALYYDI